MFPSLQQCHKATSFMLRPILRLGLGASHARSPRNAQNLSIGQSGMALPIIINSGVHHRTLSSTGPSNNAIVLTKESNDGQVRRVTLNNPSKRNMLSYEALQKLHDALTSETEKLRTIVIDHEGVAFSAGHNLKELTNETSRDYHQKVFDLCSEVMLSIRKCNVPVIAQIDGIAAAAGCQLAASCDIVVATEKSTFSTPGASVGIFCSTPGIAVSRAASSKLASYMVLTGRSITAREAVEGGLITKCVPNTEALHSEVQDIIDSILSKSKAVLSLGKKFFYEQQELSIEEAYKRGGCVMVDNLSLNDGQEGIAAFTQKRHPNWTNS